MRDSQKRSYAEFVRKTRSRPVSMHPRFISPMFHSTHLYIIDCPSSETRELAHAERRASIARRHAESMWENGANRVHPPRASAGPRTALLCPGPGSCVVRERRRGLAGARGREEGQPRAFAFASQHGRRARRRGGTILRVAGKSSMPRYTSAAQAVLARRCERMRLSVRDRGMDERLRSHLTDELRSADRTWWRRGTVLSRLRRASAAASRRVSVRLRDGAAALALTPRRPIPQSALVWRCAARGSRFGAANACGVRCTSVSTPPSAQRSASHQSGLGQHVLTSTSCIIRR
mgnify:CR=1 FL=1